MKDATRSYIPIEKSDLKKLARLARTDREDFFKKYPRYAPLNNRVICVALCQGAALHYIDGENGIKDFDVWTFYAELPSVKWYPKRIKSVDFGNPKFGQYPTCPSYIGRPVDLIGRSLNIGTDTHPVNILRKYLSEGKTESARCLAKKAVVLIEPSNLLGLVIWPV